MADDDKPKEDVRSFIFERELAEVYLLLDFLSGRSDKNLSTAFNGADLPPVMSVGGAVGVAAGGQSGSSTSLASAHAWIGAICQIRRACRRHSSCLLCDAPCRECSPA